VIEGAPVEVWGQNPGEEEEAQGRPFVGKTGIAMERQYLKLANLTRGEVTIRNVIRCRVKGTNDLPEVTSTLARDAMRHCDRAYGPLNYRPRLIVTQGDYACWVATGSHASSTWRGWLVPWVQTAEAGAQNITVWQPGRESVPVLVTAHLARLYRVPHLTLPTMMDWAKVPRILAGAWPRRPQPYQVEPVEEWPSRFAFDTEYDPSDHSKLLRYSLAWPLPGGVAVRVVEAQDHVIPTLVGRPRVITQYAAADVRHLATLSATGPDVWGRFAVEDTIVKHATLYSDMPHNLDFLGSLYATMNRWKHLRTVRGQEGLYAGCDAQGTLEVDAALDRELDRDPQSRQVYEKIDLPMLRHFVSRQYQGLRVDQARVNEVAAMLRADVQDAEARARMWMGWPMNVGSPEQVAEYLFNVAKIKPPRGAKRGKKG